MDMFTESKKSIDELDRKTERLLMEENNKDCIPTKRFNTIQNYNFKKDSTYRSIDSVSILSNHFFNNNIKGLLCNVANYTVGRGRRVNHWSFDTTTLDLSKCNHWDTVIVAKTVKILLGLNLTEVANTNLTKLILIQSNHSLFKHWLDRLNGRGYWNDGFNPIQLNLHYTNKVFFQNEQATIIPGLFTFDKSFTNGTYILKENTSEFILENGENKNFNNPIEMKASDVKGVHTVKGVIMVKKRGELVPKPFEFRYIVE